LPRRWPSHSPQVPANKPRPPSTRTSAPTRHPTVPHLRADPPKTKAHRRDPARLEVAGSPGATGCSRSVRRWRTCRRCRGEVVGLAKALIASGIGAGDRVAILAATRYEWTLFDFGIWAAGAVPVPIYATSSAEQVEWILADSGTVAIVVENAAQAAKIDEIR